MEKFPTPPDLLKVGKRGWEKFLHSHRLYRPETYAKRLEIFKRAANLPYEKRLPAPRVDLPWLEFACFILSKVRLRPIAQR